jgi:DNA recombination protein RmuC
MSAQLEQVSRFMSEVQAERAQQYGALANQLRMTGEQTAMLAQTTATLREALANTRVRGQWGERMAEDILRLAGFIENVNYQKQETIEGGSTRPDFTFFLPRNLKLNMDVKFPLDNYLKLLEAPSDAERERLRAAFLRDIKNRIKEVTSRDYINPAQNTVDVGSVGDMSEGVVRRSIEAQTHE